MSHVQFSIELLYAVDHFSFFFILLR